MAAQTGSTHISGTMIDSVEIQTENLKVPQMILTMTNNQKYSYMVVQTGYTHNSATL